MGDLILEGLQLLAAHGGLVEVRALEVREGNPNFSATWSGYFDPEHLTDAAQSITESLDGHAMGI